MADDLALYVDAFYISPYAFSAYVALREKGIPFEIRVVPLQEKGQQRPDYRDRSLTARVPALAHAGFWLSESSAIDEYLEDAFPPPGHPALYPRDVRAHARARQVQAWLRSDLGALREERPTTTMFYQRADRPLSDAGRAAAEKLARVTERVLTPGRCISSTRGRSPTPISRSCCTACCATAIRCPRACATMPSISGGVRRYASGTSRSGSR